MKQSIMKILVFQIERGNVDGTNRMILVNHLSYPWGLAVYGPFLYYTDEEYEVIERVDKATGANKIVLRDNVPNLRGLQIYQRRGEYLSLKHTYSWVYIYLFMGVCTLTCPHNKPTYAQNGVHTHACKLKLPQDI